VEFRDRLRAEIRGLKIYIVVRGDLPCFPLLPPYSFVWDGNPAKSRKYARRCPDNPGEGYMYLTMHTRNHHLDYNTTAKTL
jgi:hypothetical protein